MEFLLANEPLMFLVRFQRFWMRFLSGVDYEAFFGVHLEEAVDGELLGFGDNEILFRVSFVIHRS